MSLNLINDNDAIFFGLTSSGKMKKCTVSKVFLSEKIF